MPGAPSSRWDLIEDACDAIGLQLLEQHGGDGMWEKLENMWSEGLVELTQLLEIHQVPACLLVGFITVWAAACVSFRTSAALYCTEGARSLANQTPLREAQYEASFGRARSRSKLHRARAEVYT